MSFLIIALIVVLVVSLRWNWWRLPKAGLPILMYHKIGVPPPGSKLTKLWVSSEQFRRQMAFLKNRGFTPITFATLYSHWDRGTSLPEKPVIITFDDGYRNNAELAAPILKEFGFPATIFVVVDTIEGDNRWHDPKSETRIAMLSWDEVKHLHAEGWEIGSHTLHHHRLVTLTPVQVAEELEKSRSILSQKLGIVIDSFAYPYGNGEDVLAIREAVKAAGYRTAVGVHAGKWTSAQLKVSPFNLPRIFVRGDENLLDFSLQLTRGQSRL